MSEKQDIQNFNELLEFHDDIIPKFTSAPDSDYLGVQGVFGAVPPDEPYKSTFGADLLEGIAGTAVSVSDWASEFASDLGEKDLPNALWDNLLGRNGAGYNNRTEFFNDFPAVSGLAFSKEGAKFREQYDNYNTPAQIEERTQTIVGNLVENEGYSVEDAFAVYERWNSVGIDNLNDAETKIINQALFDENLVTNELFFGLGGKSIIKGLSKTKAGKNFLGKYIGKFNKYINPRKYKLAKNIDKDGLGVKTGDISPTIVSNLNKYKNVKNLDKGLLNVSKGYVGQITRDKTFLKTIKMSAEDASKLSVEQLSELGMKNMSRIQMDNLVKRIGANKDLTNTFKKHFWNSKNDDYLAMLRNPVKDLKYKLAKDAGIKDRLGAGFKGVTQEFSKTSRSWLNRQLDPEQYRFAFQGKGIMPNINPLSIKGGIKQPILARLLKAQVLNEAINLSTAPDLIEKAGTALGDNYVGNFLSGVVGEGLEEGSLFSAANLFTDATNIPFGISPFPSGVQELAKLTDEFIGFEYGEGRPYKEIFQVKVGEDSDKNAQYEDKMITVRPGDREYITDEKLDSIRTKSGASILYGD